MTGEEPTTVRAATAQSNRRALRAVAALGARLDDQHVPRRPEWDCQTCEQDWPCAPARVRLSEAYRRDHIGLSMYMGALLPIAIQERPDDDARELHERIVGWTR